MSNSAPRYGLQAWAFRLAVFVGIVLLIGEFSYLRSRQLSRAEAQAIASANDIVASKTQTARAHLALQHWDEAIRHLEDALSLEKATNRDEALSLWEQARRGQADTLLDAADTAITRKDVASALRLLRAYLAHPQASKRERAEQLCADLDLATSDEEAARLLANLSDEALRLFKESGQWTVEDGPRTQSARAIFRDTLRRHLAEEMEKRRAKQMAARLARERSAAERARQVARLRKTAAFRALSVFVTQTLSQIRDQRQLARRQEAALGQLFQQLGVNDPQEQAKLRADFIDRDGIPRIVESVDRKRAEIKQAYHAAPEFHETDRELFDQLVDQELDNLLRALDAA